VSTLALQAGGSLRLPMSYEDYLALGEQKHSEYLDGCLVRNPPTLRHVRVARRSTRLLEDAVPPGYDVLPEAGWRIEPDTVEPDVLVAPVDAPGPDLLRVPPLLVVEVTSPSTRGDDWGRKRELYAEGGAGWYWLADPDADRLAVLRAERGVFVDVTQAVAPAILRLAEPFAIDVDLAVVFA
jgi:Uma2 family endonuclease